MSVDAVHARALDALRRNEMDLLARLLADNPSLAHVPSEEGSYLIDRCACPSSTDPAHGGYAQALAMLLEAGADPDRTVAAGGQQTLRMAASVGHEAAVGLLIDRGARIDGDPNDLRSPLGEAIYWQQRAIVVQLLEAGASTAKLYVAAGVGRRAAVEAHFDASGALCAQAVGSAPDGGTGDAPPSDRQAILNEAWIYAVHGGHAETADYLLDRGAQIDAIEPTAWMPMRVSALHFAALRGDRSAIDYLLSRGANAALRDRQYSASPDGWAEYNGYPELADLIRAHARAKGDST